MAARDINLNRIQIFNLVVELGSFSKAARQLKVPISNISRNIAELEAQLKLQLLYRTTRQLQPTAAGKQLYAGSREALFRIEETIRRLDSNRKEISGLIKVTAPEDLGSIMMAITSDFLKKHPRVQIDWRLTNAYLNLVGDGFDLSVRVGIIKNASLIIRKLGSTKIVLVASAAFADSFEKLLTLQSIHESPLVVLRSTAADNVLELQSGNKKRKIKISPACIVDSANAARDAALNGMGVAEAPLVICRQHLASQELVRILPEWNLGEVPIQLVMPPQKEKRAVVSAFADHVANSLKEKFIFT